MLLYISRYLRELDLKLRFFTLNIAVNVTEIMIKFLHGSAGILSGGIRNYLSPCCKFLVAYSYVCKNMAIC